jgi:hypothetical protein
MESVVRVDALAARNPCPTEVRAQQKVVVLELHERIGIEDDAKRIAVALSYADGRRRSVVLDLEAPTHATSGLRMHDVLVASGERIGTGVEDVGTAVLEERGVVGQLVFAP